MSLDRVPMSREGYDKLKGELDHFEHTEMPRIAKEIGRTRGFGDLSENAEFHAAVEAQGMLEARIRHLRDKLNRAYLIDTSNLPNDQVVFGARVRVKDLELDEVEVYHLVGAGEEDYDQGKILVTSPLGKGLVGKRVGEVAEVVVPMGSLRLEIIEISFG